MATLLVSITQFFAVRAIRLSALAVLTLAMLGTLAWQTRQFIHQLDNHAPVAAVETAKATTQTTENKPSSSLLSLFGAKNPDADLSAQALEKLPESNLNLQVSAIFFKARAEQSSVILEDGDRTLMLKPGDEARPGIVVQAIESHRITLKRNGKLEQISFKGFGEMPAGNSIGSPLPAAPEITAEPVISQNNDNQVIAQVPVDMAPAAPPAVEQNSPTAYQQYIQRKLAQTK